MSTAAHVPSAPDTLEDVGFIARLARQLVLKKLGALQDGQLQVVLEDGEERLFGATSEGATSESDLRARVTIHSPAFYSKIAFGGTLGASEAFMDGDWTADEPTNVVRILLRNRGQLDGIEGGWGRLLKPAHMVVHWLRRNTRAGARKNIEAHYDLGNDFYELFLDPTMMYSCAVYENPEMTLEEASTAKLDRLCQKLDLQPEDHVLEIGTGWGGFAEHAVKNYGCRVTTTTISPSQASYARERIQKAGLAERVEILEKDYRDLEGSYDKLVSIEMIEAIGHDQMNQFFEVCSARLKDDGIMALQAITIADRFYERSRRSVDFIQRYIFPGSALPSVGSLNRSIARTDLTALHMEDIGPHYAVTLATWRQRFFDNLKSIQELGFSDRFVRTWQYYFCYCEGGFSERSIGDIQLVLSKPMARPRSLLGSLQRPL